jgi:hypothetical protein
MKSLKKFITLNQAAKKSGYTQDYLGWLIRKGEIKGLKVGRNWCTTENEIKNYLFKQKVRRGHLALRGFFSERRVYTIITVAVLVFIGGFYITTAAYSQKDSFSSPTNTILSPDVEVIEVAQL